MYFEEAVVKEYPRKDGKPNKQLNLGVNSKFNKKDKVMVISSDKIETFKQNLEPKTKELENKLSVCRDENQQLKDGLKKLELEKSEIVSKYNDIIENANNNMLEATQKVLDKEAEINELNRQHAKEIKEKDEEIKELNSKLSNEKDISKTLLVGLYAYEERGIIDNLFNRTPKLVKRLLEENPKPIETTKKE